MYEVRGDVIAIFIRRKGERLEALIDKSDFVKVNSFPGSWTTSYKKANNTFYVQKRYNKGEFSYLHRFLLEPKQGKVIDHINHNGLDNRRENLRELTHFENLQNRKPQKNNKLGMRGVYYHKSTKRFCVNIKLNSKPIYIGVFKTSEEAEKAAIEARKKYMPFANGL